MVKYNVYDIGKTAVSWIDILLLYGQVFPYCLFVYSSIHWENIRVHARHATEVTDGSDINQKIQDASNWNRKVFAVTTVENVSLWKAAWNAIFAIRFVFQFLCSSYFYTFFLINLISNNVLWRVIGLLWGNERHFCRSYAVHFPFHFYSIIYF